MTWLEWRLIELGATREQSHFGTLGMIWANLRGRQSAASLFFPILLTLAIALAVAGCRKPVDNGGGILMEESIAPMPARVGSEIISIRMTNAAHEPVTGAHIRLEGNMNHPGMAPEFADASEISPGSYSAPLDFTMGGDWVILFHVTLIDGRKIERQVDVKGVESR
jgi:hypothetical protein